MENLINKEKDLHSADVSLFTKEQFDYVMYIEDIYLRSHLLHQVRLRDNMEKDRDKFERMYNDLCIKQQLIQQKEPIGKSESEFGSCNIYPNAIHDLSEKVADKNNAEHINRIVGTFCEKCREIICICNRNKMLDILFKYKTITNATGRFYHEDYVLKAMHEFVQQKEPKPLTEEIIIKESEDWYYNFCGKKTEINYNEMPAFREGMRKANKLIFRNEIKTSSDAIGFADWLMDNCTLSEDNSLWSLNSDGEDYSLEKLYELFKKYT